MRQITQQAANAFNNGYTFSKDNTRVDLIDNDVVLYLHNNRIASRNINSDIITFSMCGWGTVTTRERLQAAGAIIAQRKGEQYLLHGREEILIDSGTTYEYNRYTGSVVEENHAEELRLCNNT